MDGTTKQKHSAGKKAQDTYLYGIHKGHVDLAPETLSECPYRMHEDVNNQQMKDLNNLRSRVAKLKEVKFLHALLQYPKSRTELSAKVDEMTARHLTMWKEDRTEYRKNFFRYLVWHRVRNFLDGLDAEGWDLFYENSSAQTLLRYSKYKTIDFLLTAVEEEPCICLETMEADDVNERKTFRTQRKLRQDLNTRIGDSDHGVYTKEECEKRVRLSTAHENVRRFLKAEYTKNRSCTASGSKDMAGCIGKWAHAELTETWTAGRDRNINFSGSEPRCGKTHLAEHLVGMVHGLPGGAHLVHVTSNHSFGHEGASKERQQR